MGALVRLEPGSLFARDYRVVRPLAEGGMGAVYVAAQLSTGKERALKILYPQFADDAKGRERFVQEAQVGARLESDHVAEVVAAGVDETTGTPWLAMEMLKGETLADPVARHGPLPPSEVVAVLRQLCDALATAHAAGVVHRDLKPANLFLASPRRRGVPFTLKVLDFGIAQIVRDQRTAVTATSALGTPAWMAPEQADQDGQIGPATDVWPLGLIAFWALTARHYWKTANDAAPKLAALLREIVLDPLIPASVRAAELGVGPLPSGFDAWFAGCVARERRDRYRDGDAAHRAFVAHLSGKPARTGGVAKTAAMPMPAPLPLSSGETERISDERGGRRRRESDASGDPPPRGFLRRLSSLVAQRPSRGVATWVLLGLGLLSGAGGVALVALGNGGAGSAGGGPAPVLGGHDSRLARRVARLLVAAVVLVALAGAASAVTLFGSAFGAATAITAVALGLAIAAVHLFAMSGLQRSVAPDPARRRP